MANPKFLEQMREVAKLTSRKAGRDMIDAHNKALELVQTFGEEFLTMKEREPSLAGFVALYHDLRKQGYKFPLAQMDAGRPTVLTPPAHAAKLDPHGVSPAHAAIALGGAGASAPAPAPAVPQSSHPRFTGELGVLENTVDMIEAMIAASAGSKQELAANDAAADMVAILRANEPHLVARIDKALAGGPGDLEGLLVLNDRVVSALAQYQSVMSGKGLGRAAPAAAPPAAAAVATPATSTAATAQADLLGLSAPPPAAAASATSSATSGAAQARSRTASSASARPPAAAAVAAPTSTKHVKQMTDEELFAAFGDAHIRDAASEAPSAAPAARPAPAAAAPASGGGHRASSATVAPVLPQLVPGGITSTDSQPGTKAKVPLLRPPPGGPTGPSSARGDRARSASSAAAAELDAVFGSAAPRSATPVGAVPAAQASGQDPFAPQGAQQFSTAANRNTPQGIAVARAPAADDPFAVVNAAHAASTLTSTAAVDPFAASFPASGALAGRDPFASGPAPAVSGRGPLAAAPVPADAPAVASQHRRDSGSAIAAAFDGLAASTLVSASQQAPVPYYSSTLPPRPAVMAAGSGHQTQGGVSYAPLPGTAPHGAPPGVPGYGMPPSVYGAPVAAWPAAATGPPAHQATGVMYYGTAPPHAHASVAGAPMPMPVPSSAAWPATATAFAPSAAGHAHSTTHNPFD